MAAKGRHDPCVVPRAVPIVEAMAALVLMEWVYFPFRSPVTEMFTISKILIQNARRASASLLPPIDYLPPSMIMPPQRVLKKLAEDPEIEAVVAESA